jgi:hypothetical protein
MPRVKWTSDHNKQVHYDRHVRPRDSCWCSLLKRSFVGEAEYHQAAIDAIDSPLYQFRAEMKGDDGQFRLPCVYSFGDRLVQSITNSSISRLITCYHMHKTSSGCRVMGRPSGEQIEELERWIETSKKVGKVRDVVKLR